MFEALHDVLYCPTVDAEKIHWLGKAGPAASCVIATVAVCVRSVEVKVTVAGRGSVCGFTSAVMRICWT